MRTDRKHWLWVEIKSFLDYEIETCINRDVDILGMVVEIKSFLDYEIETSLPLNLQFYVPEVEIKSFSITRLKT